MPKMSVVIPAYNAERYISEALISLQKQTLADFEAIIVNDGSTDSTRAITDSFCASDSRFISFYQENSGVYAARNRALEKATGKYVAFLDSDDIFTKDSLKALYDTLEETGADMAVCRLQSFGAGGEKFNPYADKLANKKEISAFDYDLVWNYLIGNKCFRRASLDASDTRFPPFKYSEDGAFIYDFMLPSRRAAGAVGACYKYRRHEPHDASVTQTVKMELVRDYIAAMRLIYDKAESAAPHAPADVEIKDFLQELIYKSDFALITQFYRLFWQADDETLGAIGAEHERLWRLMEDRTQAKAARQWQDIGRLVFSRAEMASRPSVSVIVSGLEGEPLKTTVESIFYQSMPAFEVIISENEAGGGDIPPKWLDCENTVVLPDGAFVKNAKKSARSKKRLVLKKRLAADTRLFKFLLNMSLPEKIKDRCFGLLFRAAKKAVEMKRL